VVASGGKQVRAQATMPHPMYNPNTGLNDDVGLIHLATPVTDRTAVPLNRSATAAAVGIHLEMIGFGVNTSGGNSAGVEYFLEDKATESCTNVGDPGALDTNLLCWSQKDAAGTVSGKCEGDSGGPSFAMINNQKFQVGITSVGWSNSSVQTACDGFGADTRVDHVMPWLDTTIGDEIKCAADGVCTQNCPSDPDCPSCQQDADCTGDMQVCDHGHCVPAPNTPGGVGSTCTMDTDCASGICATVGTDKKCSEVCDTSTDSCPSGFDCLPTGTSGTAGACWPGANGGGDGSCSASSSGAGASLFLVGFAALFVGRSRRRRSFETAR
jgi:MYXO-CTERM domain-containing protein